MQFAVKASDPKYAVFAHLPRGQFLIEARKVDEQERADREPPLRQSMRTINTELGEALASVREALESLPPSVRVALDADLRENTRGIAELLGTLPDLKAGRGEPAEN